MLDSMIVNPRPTRAELTDVANAIFDGTSAVMLSGETSAGAYPVESVKTMDRIARTVEQSSDFKARINAIRPECFSAAHHSNENLSIIMARSGVEIAASVDAKAIVTPTLSGNTARILSVFRPDVPIIAVTPDQRAERMMQLYWGVKTFLRPNVDDSESMIQDTMQVISDEGVAGISDKVLLVAGLPLNSPNMVNTARVIVVGTVLARTSAGGFASPGITRATGRVIHIETPDDIRDGAAADLCNSEILVCKVLTEEYTPIIRLVNGVICEEISELNEQQLSYINPRLVWLTHIRNATKYLESGLTVTLDAKQLLVYEGRV
jgi:pyruvate kinase